MPVTVTLEDDVAQGALDHIRECPSTPSRCLLCVIAVALNGAEHHVTSTTCTCHQPDDRNRRHRYDGAPCRSLYRVDL